MFGMVPFRKNDNSIAKRGDYFDQLFDNFFSDDFFMPSNYIQSAFKVDLKENENEYSIEADLPGVKKDAIDIQYENNYLTISARREDTLEENKDNYVRRERHYGEFKRSFYIDNVDQNNISASFKDGVLDVNIPKQEKQLSRNKKIDIN